MSKRRFRIDTGKYGGELVIGKINKEFVEFMSDHDENDLIETLQKYDFEDDDMGVEGAPKPNSDFYSWSECDDIEHLNNAYSDAGFTITEVPSDGTDDYTWNEDEITTEGYQLYGREAYHEDKIPEPT